MGSRNQEVSIKHSRDSERVRITRIAIRVDPMFLESFVPLLSHYPSIALKPLKPHISRDQRCCPRARSRRPLHLIHIHMWRPFSHNSLPNRARVLQNQNPFQERAAGKWCKGRLPRKFSRSTRATSGGTRAIADHQPHCQNAGVG